MAPSQKFIIQDNAYLKFFLHAAAHPHASVVGLLVGPIKTESGAADECIVSDAIPLLHHWTNLSPMMEVGLSLAGIYAKDSGLRVVGYYQANENIDDVELSPIGHQVLNLLSKDFTSPFALVFNAANVPSGSPALQIHMIQRPSGGSSQPSSDSFDLADDSIPTRSLRAVRERNLQAYLADFDDFLEDGSADWLQNSAVGR